MCAYCRYPRHDISGEIPLHTDVASLIDHTLLKPDATLAQLTQVCQEALHYGFAAVCVNPCYVSAAAGLLRGSAVKVCTVVGFPLGATLTSVKVYEAQEAIRAGAQEIDMVIHLGALKSGRDAEVASDISEVVQASHRGGAICKVIVEAALLSRDEKIRVAGMCKIAGADFVKTSTGFGAGGATVEDVALLRSLVGPDMGIKAAGGIRDLADLRKLVSAGATRIGASASVKIMAQAKSEKSGPET
jgi:deoxyribose-phosphate aldolase